jgi:hypothetical protein
MAQRAQPSKREARGNRGGGVRAANMIEAMRRRSPTVLTPLLGMALAALLAGCGGGTKTVDASTPLPEATTSTSAPQTNATTTGTTTTTSTTPSTTTTSGENGGTAGPSTTRTAPAPAFTHQGGTGTTTSGEGGEGLSAAEAVVQAKGFTVAAPSDYHPDQTLRVLVGTRTGSAEGNGQQAFFFVDGRYIGTDAKQPSAQINVVSQGDTEVALAYALAGGGQATVRFQLNNGKLVPLGPIPSASARQ